ncbi:MAG: hypothetical protein NT154_13535, partial [Verrucomicrobia bacterium]|nr:hypothetical protein [Verrucomicrobiota bacterium]
MASQVAPFVDIFFVWLQFFDRLRTQWLRLLRFSSAVTAVVSSAGVPGAFAVFARRVSQVGHVSFCVQITYMEICVFFPSPLSPIGPGTLDHRIAVSVQATAPPIPRLAPVPFARWALGRLTFSARAVGRLRPG